MSKHAIIGRFTPGLRVTVTNHYITRIDHPCFGTRTATVVRASGSHLYFEGVAGGTPWPKKAADLRTDGDTVFFYGFPNEGDLFLTIVPELHR